MENTFDEVILAGCSRAILEGSQNIKRNNRIKTDLQKKKYLVELWNRNLDLAIQATNDERNIAVLRGYYGAVTSKILNLLSIQDCYIYIHKWAMLLCIGWKGGWEHE